MSEVVSEDREASRLGESFVASSWTLMARKFKRHKLAIAGTVVLCVFYLAGAIAPDFFSTSPAFKRYARSAPATHLPRQDVPAQRSAPRRWPGSGDIRTEARRGHPSEQYPLRLDTVLPTSLKHLLAPPCRYRYWHSPTRSTNLTSS